MINVKKYIRLPYLCLVMLMSCNNPSDMQAQIPNGGTPTKEQVLMQSVLSSIERYHYEPKALDDVYSEAVFNQYFKVLDNNKRYFLQSDIDQFAKHKKNIDDQARTGSFDFYNEVNEVYNKRIEMIHGFYTEILAQPFDYKVKESIETDGEKLKFATTEAELKDRWRKSLKFQVLTRIQTRLELQEESLNKKDSLSKKDLNATEKKDTAITIKTFDEIEKEEREKALKNYNTWYTKVTKEKNEVRLSYFINSFLAVLEPHTEFFPPLEKENFDIRMAGKLEGIGAQLIEEDGFITVSRIVPGSAAWRQGELKEKDKIIKVGQGEQEPVDVVDMSMDEVLPMIRGAKNTEVRLTVRKEDGTILTIPIVRDVVVLEDSYAKSAILEHEKAKVKVGLIDLRSFYADFQDQRGRRSGRDVRAEVQKLIAEEVDGIVIDLRFNGGGSLSDVVDMTGLFIDKGPVVQVRDRNERNTVLEDRDAGVLYNGPLVILVNSASASASEILAAALQDYGRAIIVGTAPTTFGKGTVQRFVGLDDELPRNLRALNLGELGAIKVTIQKFYRINGSSTQLKGVVPDIILPSQYSYLEIGEREEDFPMKWTETAPANYKEKATIRNVDKIKSQSAKRINSNKLYKQVEEHARWTKQNYDQSKYSLNFEEYKATRKAQNDKAKAYKPIYETDMLDIKVSSLLADQPAILNDKARKESTEAWHKNLKKDFYLEEAIFIIKDLKK